MNKVMLTGRISKDIFLQEKFAIITLAVQKEYDRTKVDYIPILVSGPIIKDISKKYFKGDMLFIQGLVTVFAKDGKQIVGINGESIEYISPGKIHKKMDEDKSGEQSS